MLINGKQISIEELLKEDSSVGFLKKRKNNIYLSDNDISILEKYHIDYNSCNNLKELLFQIEDYLMEEDEAQDLENLSEKLAEYDYYHNTNK